MARKQARGTQIFSVAARRAPSAALIVTTALTMVVAAVAPLWAQARKSAQPQKSAPAQRSAQAQRPQRSAESAVSAVEREIKQAQTRLDSIRAELESGRERVKELQKEEGSYQSRLEQIQKNLIISGQYMDMVQKQIDTTEHRLELLGDSLTKAEADLTHAREMMKRRLRNAQMTSEMGWLQMLLTAKSPAELVHRVQYFQDLNRYDRRLAETIRASIESVNEKRSSQEAHKEALGMLLDDKRQEQIALAEEEAERRAVLEDIRTKRDASAAVVAELEEAHIELSEILKRLEETRRRVKTEEEERAAAISFERRKGKLGWPAVGEVTSKFGRVVHPVYKTVIMNNGIDIAARRRTPVYNVAPGTVVLVDWIRGHGRTVIVDHSGGYITLYAHLGEISVAKDQDIAIGAEIGKVGETGTASGPKLHFKIMRSAEPLDPEEWLER